MGVVSSRALLGAILAGGESTRYGAPKALATLAGQPMGAWAVQALQPHLMHMGVLTGDPATAMALGLPGREDPTPGQGPLGGLVSALTWAGELGLGGVFLLACDLPLVDGDTVGRILDSGFQGRDALVPASPGPLGMEPLCAAYSLACLHPARDLLASGRRSMKGLLEEVEFTLVSLEALGGAAEGAVRFRNVNTREEARAVEMLLLKRDEAGVAGPVNPGTQTTGPVITDEG